jgi:hypothetical protein
MFFKMAYGQRKAQERLLKLYKAGKVKRERGDTYYYFHQKPGMVTHQLSLNWVRLWLEKTCKSWEKLQSFSYEQDYGVLRTDGFASFKNTVSGKMRFLFIEMDMGTNTFEKRIEKYCKLYESEKFMSWWWARLAERFPPVLIVTTRKERINELIKKENSAGLEFQVKSLEEVKSEVV